MGECIETETICIVRGDSWEFVVSLDDGFAEVILEPEDYLLQLVLRDDQNDLLTPRLILEVDDAEIVTPIPVVPGMPRLFYTFTATPTQTTSLPRWDLVGYVELRSTNDTIVERLFNLKASIKD